MGTLSGYDAWGSRTREGREDAEIDAEVGTLEQGKRADLRRARPREAGGPRRRPRGADLFGGGFPRRASCAVDGEFLVRDGRPTKMDATRCARKPPNSSALS